MGHTITIYTDGASKGNPGPGGWGAIVATSSLVREYGGHEDHTTNNRMEMNAALQGLTHAAHLSHAHEADVEVFTDSSYLINGITKWVRGWKARGWQTAQKEPVLNRDLWEALDDIASQFRAISWRHVGGHVGIAGNERVDEIASGFALCEKIALYDGARGVYGIAIDSVAHDDAKLRARTASRSRSNAKAFSYVSLVDGIVATHATWKECEMRVRGKRARYKKALSAEDESSIIKEFSRSI